MYSLWKEVNNAFEFVSDFPDLDDAKAYAQVNNVIYYQIEFTDENGLVTIVDSFLYQG